MRGPQVEQLEHEPAVAILGRFEEAAFLECDLLDRLGNGADVSRRKGLTIRVRKVR